jgi:hypothetical protein
VVCNQSSTMTHTRCAAVKGPKCGSCPGAGTEIITFDEATYEALQELAEFEGVSVAVALTRWITELATELRQREGARGE